MFVPVRPPVIAVIGTETGRRKRRNMGTGITVKHSGWLRGQRKTRKGKKLDRGKEGEGKGKASPYSTILCLSDGGRSWTDLGNGDLDDLEPSPQWLKW